MTHPVICTSLVFVNNKLNCIRPVRDIKLLKHRGGLEGGGANFGTLKIKYQETTLTVDVHVTVHRDKFLTIKPIRCTNFSNLFWIETLHVSDSPSIHHQDGTHFHPDPARKLYDMTCATYTNAVCTVKNSCWWTEELSETCWVSFQK